MSSHLRTGEDDARSHEPIAVVGFAFEFPEEATSDEAFWQMICQGRSASKVFPKDRLNIDGLYNADTTRHNTVSRAMLISLRFKTPVAYNGISDPSTRRKLFA